jgi:2',3'-cyclic-nucleotide 2'-phosphodiesterase (5'-nucleotidase family)
VAELDFRDPVETALKYIPLMRRGGATVIIVLAHMGAEWDPAQGAWNGELVELTHELSGEADLISSGHTHTYISQKLNDVPVMQSGAKGLAFGRVDLFVDRASGHVRPELTRISEPTYFLHKSLSGAPSTYHGVPVRADPAFASEFKKFSARVEEVRRKVIGTTAEDIPNDGEFDTPIGRVVTDAMCAAALGKASVCLLNRGSLRAPLPNGKITFADVYAVTPFENKIILVTVTGKQIVTSLEHGLSSTYGPLELSGLAVNYDKQNAPGSRVVKVLLPDGKAVQDDQQYRVAVNDFLYSGGDGFSAFGKGTEMENTHLALRVVLGEYVTARPGLRVPREHRYQLITDKLH